MSPLRNQGSRFSRKQELHHVIGLAIVIKKNKNKMQLPISVINNIMYNNNIAKSK
ncbi:hypothetical protein [Candidatus Tisiphia endosymbiont of Xenochironomus xenolabis]|uniref:hypothetical protein n=1 Tax=Candidatus Tisiphia endosymbiont of Xenochironomus xenolabis TaxID=3139334 RepID=UPI0035C89A7E